MSDTVSMFPQVQGCLDVFSQGGGGHCLDEVLRSYVVVVCLT